jgi:putative transposase
MGRKYQIRDQEKLYFITFTTVNLIDVFIRDEYRQIIVDSLRFCQENKGLEVYA